MTIDEAIKHSEEVAERYERMEDSHDDKLKEECLQCAADHRQLAEWLGQLKRAKAMMLDTSYTLDAMCDKVSRELGCKECVYYDGDTHICKVREWIKRLRIFSKAIKG